MSSADNKKDKKDKKKEKKEKKAKREREEANLHHVTGRQWMLEEERKAEQNETFVWGAKREVRDVKKKKVSDFAFFFSETFQKLIQQGLTPEQMAQEQERTRLERLAELEKIKALRAQRDLEAELFEQEKRRAESANFSYNGWLEEERQFHLKQAKERAEIRLKEGRPKPIDILAKNLEVDLKYDFHMQPFQMLQGLSEPQLQDLATDIDMYVELMPEAKEFWSALKLLCSEQIAILTGKRAPVSRDILDVFNGQSLEELLELQTNIAAQMEEGEDPEYWDALDKRCAVEIAKTKLAKIHAEKLQERLAQMDEKNREEERLRLEAVLRNKMEAGQVTASNAAAAALSAPSSSAPGANDEALAGASAAAPRVRRREKLVLDEIEEIGGEEGDELARQDERIRELMEETRELDNMMIRGGGGGGDEVDFDGAQTGVMLSEHELMQLERDRPEEENEEIFADEVETQNLLAVPAWQDKLSCSLDCAVCELFKVC